MKIATTLFMILALTFATAYVVVTTVSKYLADKTRRAVLYARPSNRFSYHRFMKGK